MGQPIIKMMNISLDNSESPSAKKHKHDTVRYDPSEVSPNNGYMLSGTYFPKEILILILSYVDKTTLSGSCLIVCRKWYEIIMEDVWKEKAEREKRHCFTKVDHYVRYPNVIYQGICCKDAYCRNLMKNYSGADGFRHWKIIKQGGDRWKTESPPVGVSGGDFDANRHITCFVTSYGACSKVQIVDLLKEGISPEILDDYRPDITISENYAARWDSQADYRIVVKLLNADNEDLEVFVFKARAWEGDGWQEVKHTFSSYKRGVRYVFFSHRGCDVPFWAGHYGSKMANACVTVETVSSYLTNLDKDAGVDSI